MQAFKCHTGRALPFDRANVDTDVILPKQYLKSISKVGYGDWLFDDLRYIDPGDVQTASGSRRINPDFVLNQPKYQGASIVLSRANFGCGSSREPAVWALRDYGIGVVIAPSFADIFYNNCFKNGLLPVILSVEQVNTLIDLCDRDRCLELTIDLESCEIYSTSAGLRWSFELDKARRNNLLSGRDEISVTLLEREKIISFEQTMRDKEPWLFNPLASSIE
ncbi:MAG: 3-isopropylmalate/(R)-2-methylmalate dehydratase small subunit [Oceanicoccus sp.]|jgi:3-isopropylmalate/(R)-2-methylmalate dehydratase small subunit